jgi:hypothetical protein
MKAIVSDSATERHLGKRLPRVTASSVLPAACLALGGLLTVAWVGTLGPCAYKATCWIVG